MHHSSVCTLLTSVVSKGRTVQFWASRAAAQRADVRECAQSRVPPTVVYRRMREQFYICARGLSAVTYTAVSCTYGSTSEVSNGYIVPKSRGIKKKTPKSLSAILSALSLVSRESLPVRGRPRAGVGRVSLVSTATPSSVSRLSFSRLQLEVSRDRRDSRRAAPPGLSVSRETTARGS